MKSNCCNTEVIENTDLCSECLEHCVIEYAADDLKDKSFEEQIIIMESGK